MFSSFMFGALIGAAIAVGTRYYIDSRKSGGGPGEEKGGGGPGEEDPKK